MKSEKTSTIKALKFQSGLTLNWPGLSKTVSVTSCPTATNNYFRLKSDEHVSSTTVPVWISPLYYRHTEWDIFISVLYLLSVEEMFFHDAAVKGWPSSVLGDQTI